MEAWLAEAVPVDPKRGARIVAQSQIKDYRLQSVSFSWKRIHTDGTPRQVDSGRKRPPLCRR